MRALYVGSFVLLTLITGYFLLFSAASSGVTVTPQVLSSTSVEVTATQKYFLDKVNDVRTTAGVTEVEYSLDSEKLADFRVQDMVSNNYYSHKISGRYNYANYLAEYNVDAIFSCENLQLQVGESIDEAINAWVNSSQHYACLVNPKAKTISVSYDLYSSVNTVDKNTQDMYVFAMISTD